MKIDGTKQQSQKECPFGIAVFQSIVIYENKVVARIRSGHMLISEHSKIPRTVKIEPIKNQISVRKLLNTIGNSILKFYEFDEARSQIKKLKY